MGATKKGNKAKAKANGGGDESPLKGKKKHLKGDEAKEAEEEQDSDQSEGSSDREDKNKEDKDPDADEDEEKKEYRWWRDPNFIIPKKGGIQWTTLKHNGPILADPYVRHNIPIKHLGRPFLLNEEEEELITHYIKMREMDQYHNQTFRKNFFLAWKALLDRTRGPENHPFQTLSSLSECDFDDIWNWHVDERTKRRNRTKEEKQLAKKELDAILKPHRTCTWDGKEQEVTGYRIEPPGLFRGRGKHPKQGCLKRRIMPEDVTINIGEGEEVPKCPLEGHHWGGVVHNHEVQWLCMFHDTVCNNVKYVMLASTGCIKQVNDREKFEKARRLKQYVERIRDDYKECWRSKDPLKQQLGVCIYFIDKLALRVGNEKNEDEADTVGCTSLKVNNVIPKGNNVLHLSFLGKDSVPYENDVEVAPEVYSLILGLRKDKEPTMPIFDLVDSQELNAYLKKFMPDLSAKVFRTYNASWCLEQYFREHPMPAGLTLDQKMVYFNSANLAVAILCNHQRNVAKGHKAALVGMDSKLAQLQELKDRIIKAEHTRDQEKARREFYAVEEKEQWEWLNAWGTEADKNTYRDVVRKRNGEKVEKSEVKKEEMKAEPQSDDANTDTKLASLLKSRKRGRAADDSEVKVKPTDDDDRKSTDAKSEAAEEEASESEATSSREASSEPNGTSPKATKKGQPKAKKDSGSKGKGKKAATKAQKSPPKRGAAQAKGTSNSKAKGGKAKAASLSPPASAKASPKPSPKSSLKAAGKKSPKASPKPSPKKAAAKKSPTHSKKKPSPKSKKGGRK